MASSRSSSMRAILARVMHESPGSGIVWSTRRVVRCGSRSTPSAHIRDRWGRGAVHVERWTATTGKERLLVRMDPPTAARYARAAQLAVPRASPGPRSHGSARRPDRAPRFLTERQAWRAALARAAEPGDIAE